MPQPIDTAPRDGTPVLTDQGFAVYGRAWHEWIACDPSGCQYVDTYEEPIYYDCPSPTLWEPLPDWIKY